MTEQDIVNYWIRSSDENYQTMMNLFNSGDYTWSLFMGHLVIEKLIKAYFIKNTGKEPPLVHDLLRIAQKAGLDTDERMEDIFDEITTL
jgi:HEPN domain-containing protein